MDAEPKRKRRWLQFSLRSLLVFTLFCALASAWLSHKVAQKRAEREATEALAKLGAAAFYDYQFAPSPAAVAPGPEWLRNLIGEDLFSNVEAVCFSGQDNEGRQYIGAGGGINDEDLLHLNNLPNLKSLALCWTRKITDATAERLGRLRQLESLSIWGTLIDDVGLAQIKQLNRLESLSIGGNHVTDAGLANICELTGLHGLDLAEDEVTDAGLVNIEPLTRLQRLSLSGQHLTDAALSHIRNLRELKDLSVRSDSISDLGVENIRGLVHLESLSVIYSDMTDAALANLDGLTMLTQLDLTGSFITDAGLEHLKRFARLTRLTLNATKVTDAGVARFQNELPKCQVSHWKSDRPFPPKIAERNGR